MHHLLNILSYFDSLRAGRHNDPFTAEWKALQIRAWLSTVFLAVGFGLAALVANALDTFDENAIPRGLAEQLRPSAAYVVCGGLLLVLTFTAYAWWSLFRFAQKHGVE